MSGSGPHRPALRNASMHHTCVTEELSDYHEHVAVRVRNRRDLTFRKYPQRHFRCCLDIFSICVTFPRDSKTRMAEKEPVCKKKKKSKKRNSSNQPRSMRNHDLGEASAVTTIITTVSVSAINTVSSFVSVSQFRSCIQRFYSLVFENW